MLTAQSFVHVYKPAGGWKDAPELSLRFGVNYLATRPINSCKGNFQNRNLDQANHGVTATKQAWKVAPKSFLVSFFNSSSQLSTPC